MADKDIVAFDAATFDRLIAFVNACKDELDEKILAPRAGLMIDGTLDTFLKLGSREWPVVRDVLQAAGKFGASTRSRLVALSKEWGEFSKALTDAKETLKKGDDLATMSANDFAEKFPSLVPSGAGQSIFGPSTSGQSIFGPSTSGPAASGSPSADTDTEAEAEA